MKKVMKIIMVLLIGITLIPINNVNAESTDLKDDIFKGEIVCSYDKENEQMICEFPFKDEWKGKVQKITAELTKFGSKYSDVSFENFETKGDNVIGKISLSAKSGEYYSLTLKTIQSEDKNYKVGFSKSIGLTIPMDIVPITINSIDSVSSKIDDAYSKNKAVYVIVNMKSEVAEPDLALYYENANTDDKRTIYRENLIFNRKIDENHYEFKIGPSNYPSFIGVQNFKLICAKVNAYRDGVYVSRFYSPTKIDLSEYENTIDKAPFEVSDTNYSKIDTLNKLDFSLSKYFKDKTAPTIDLNTFKWNQTIIKTPGLGNYTFDIKEQESGISEVNVVLVVERKDGSTEFFKQNYPYVKDEEKYQNGNYLISGTEPINYIGSSQQLALSDKSGKLTLARITVTDNSQNINSYALEEYKTFFEDKNEWVNIDRNGNFIENEYVSRKDNYSSSFESKIEVEDFVKFNTKEELIKDFKDILDLNKYEEKTYVVDFTADNLLMQPKVIGKDIFEMLKGKNVNIVFETYQNNTIVDWKINGKDIKICKDIDIDTSLYQDNAKLNYKDNNEVFDLQAGIVDTPIGAVEISKSEVGIEEFNKFVLGRLKDRSDGGYKDAERLFKYYIDYLSQFDIKKDDFEKLFFNEYLKYSQSRVVFKDNGELPGEFTVTVKDAKSIYDDDLYNLFYIDDDGTETLVQSDIKMEDDGSYDLLISHNSTYVLRKKIVESPSIPEEPSIPSDKPSDSKPDISVPNLPGIDNSNNIGNSENILNRDVVKTADLSSVGPYVAICMIALVLCGCLYALKKEKSNR